MDYNGISVAYISPGAIGVLRENAQVSGDPYYIDRALRIMEETGCSVAEAVQKMRTIERQGTLIEKIEIKRERGTLKIFVDGQDISSWVTGEDVDINCGITQIPRVRLSLLAANLEVTEGVEEPDSEE